MAIRITDLPPEYQRQALLRYRAEQNRTSSTAVGKHGAVKTELGGIKFDSKKEARRYSELMLRLKAGEISELKLQPEFTLQEAYTTPEGERVRAVRYRADFSYLNTLGELVVEDTKSPHTRTLPVYRIKRKLMHEKLGITITEV